MGPINIGISVFAAGESQARTNEVNQNIAFLVQALRQSPQTGEIVFLGGGEGDRLPEELEFDRLNVPLLTLRDATYRLDLVIEMGAQLPLEWLHRVRTLGVKIVTFLTGSTYADLGESPMFERSMGYGFNGTPWHEVWTLPHHMKSSGPLLRTIGRVPVRAMPVLWSPMFIDSRVSALREQGHAFGFAAAGEARLRRAWRVAIFEPNASVLRNCTMPMLICEQAHRTHHDAIGLMMVMNSFHMKEHLTFNRFASHLDLTRDGRASYEPHTDLVDCMAMYRGDAIVSHQWECEFSYLYCEALYGGYPLIHNSPWLKHLGAGLYYPDFDAQAGAKVLLDAWADDSDRADYNRASSALLAAIAPEHPDNVHALSERIETLMTGEQS